MADVDSGFAELEDYVTSMLSALEGAEQRRLLSVISQNMRRSNQRRIAAQQNPDGSKFAKRKAPPDDQPSATPIKFLYPAGGVGRPRIVIMRSWKKMGEDRLIGFDRRAGGIRTFFRKHIIRYLKEDPRDAQGRDGKLSRRRVRQQAMFRKIRTARYLKAGQKPNEAWIGFVGMIGAIANVHQFGGKDKPNPFSEAVDYPERQLLGLTKKDRADLIDAVEEHLII
jgi:phage virion morphogenesis protein